MQDEQYTTTIHAQGMYSARFTKSQKGAAKLQTGKRQAVLQEPNTDETDIYTLVLKWNEIVSTWFLLACKQWCYVGQN